MERGVVVMMLLRSRHAVGDAVEGDSAIGHGAAVGCRMRFARVA